MATSMSDGAWSIMLEKQATPQGDQHFNTYAMNEDRLSLIAVGVIFTIIGSLAIGCRLSLLASRRRKPWYDDWVMLIAYGFSIGFMISSFVSVRWGVGLKTSDAPPSWATKAIQAVYAIEIFYYFSVYLVKVSLVCLYLRLSRELRNYLYTASVWLLVILTLHFITTIVVFSVQCVPMKKYWDPTTPGHCISITGFFYSTNIFTIITDVIMLALPIKTVWKVQGTLPQKFGIIAAFLSGGLSTLASCIRLYSIQVYTESKEPLRDAAPINTWSFIEIYIGMCCASAAVLRQFLNVSRQHGILSGNRSWGKRSNLESSTDWSSSGRTVTSGLRPNDIARWPSPGFPDAIHLETRPSKFSRSTTPDLFGKG